MVVEGGVAGARKDGAAGALGVAAGARGPAGLGLGAAEGVAAGDDGLGLAVAAGASVAAGEAVGNTIVVGSGPKLATATATGASLAEPVGMADATGGSVPRTIALGPADGLALFPAAPGGSRAPWPDPVGPPVSRTATSTRARLSRPSASSRRAR